MTLRFLIALIFFGFCTFVQAEIYKRVDADGHVTYSSEPIKGGKLLMDSRTASPPASPPVRTRAVSGGSPADFPKVDAATQRGRDLTRYQILKDELNSELRALDEVRLNGRQPELIRLHTKNIEALKMEIANLNR